MPETIRRAMPNEVGGILRRIVGANEEAERIKSEKFKQLRRRLVKEHALLTFDLEEAISLSALLLEEGGGFEFIRR